MRTIFLFHIAMTCILITAEARSSDPSLVAHYPFDDRSGTVLHDRSGTDNHGTIHGGLEWIELDDGTGALAFNGEDVYVDCGAAETLNIDDGGTVLLWVYPKQNQGGLVNWSVGDKLRLTLRLDAYYSGRSSLMRLGNEDEASERRDYGRLPPDTWTHLAATFDGQRVLLYRDGVLTASQWGGDRPSQKIQPQLDGVPLWIGRDGDFNHSKPYFHGMLDELRIYARALSAEQITDHYQQGAAAKGKSAAVFRQVVVEALAYPEAGKIAVSLDARGLKPPPSVIEAVISNQEHDKPIQKRRTESVYPGELSEVIFEVPKLPEGEYQIDVTAMGPDSATIGQTSSQHITWSGPADEFKGIKVLNNLCWELLNQSPVSDGKHEFDLPCDRWVFIRTVAAVGASGKVWVVLDSASEPDTLTEHYFSRTGRIKDYDKHREPPLREPDETVKDTMRFLKAGKHTLTVKKTGQAETKQLLVRAIPALQHAFYGASPNINHFGPYDWDFIQAHMPYVNVMVGGLEYYPRADALVRLADWKATGRSWISYKGVPNWANLGFTFNETEEQYRYWAQAMGFQHPLTDGVMFDEFVWGERPDYDMYREVVERLRHDFKGRQFHPYCDELFAAPSSKRFLQACMAGGGMVCWERYLWEMPTQSEALRDIHRQIVSIMPEWEAEMPGCTRQMVMVLAIASLPSWTLNINPSINFKVHMDLQMRAMATHPSLFGLGGIQWYHCGYADEETVRWMGELYRHYVIEGNDTLLSKDTYRLAHLTNPDFTDGTDGWTIRAADGGAVSTKSHRGFSSAMQGRWRKSSQGDTFLWTQRSASQPNAVSQQISNLTPGRLYSLKMMTGDYHDFVRGNSEKKLHAVSISIDDAEVLTDEKNSFQFPFKSSRSLGNFSASHSFWMNYHWRLFRAKSETAQLVITDWANDAEPGGRTGQELMLNFVEVQPYFEPAAD